MSRGNVEVVRGAFEATNRRDWESAMSAYVDDVELVVHGSFVPSGTYNGRAEVGGWFGDWLATFEPDYKFDIEEIREVGDAVVVVATHRGRGKLSGVETEARTAYAFWLQNARIGRVALYDERAEALEAVGLRE